MDEVSSSLCEEVRLNNILKNMVKVKQRLLIQKLPTTTPCPASFEVRVDHHYDTFYT